MSKYEMFKATSSIAVFARSRMQARQTKPVVSDDLGARDFLSRFLEAHKKDPTFMTKGRVLALTVANCFAGSNTTAITLRAIFYYLLRNPPSMEKLMAEVDHAKGLISWEESRGLPYLSAVIKEALRIHPAAGLPLERVVPPQGAMISGVFIPGGTIVGCNAWVVHMDKQVFGEDAAVWRPERWLEADDARRTLMNNSLFSFGSGARRWRLIDLPPVDNWIHPSNRLLVIGDAVHATLPYLAQGAAMAIEDAACLGFVLSQIVSRNQLGEALAFFYDMRKERAHTIQRGSWTNRFFIHMNEGAQYNMREEVFAAGDYPGSPNLMANSLFQDWLYGYDVLKDAKSKWQQRSSPSAKL